jgi:sucrose-6-phosphate hydrolase SacC (GH32 family)
MKTTIQALSLATLIALVAPASAADDAATITVGKRYLHFPVALSSTARNVRLSLDGEVVRYFKIAMPEDGGKPLYWASVDLESLQGRKIGVTIDPAPIGFNALALIEQSDSPRKPANLYREKYRPQFHFTPAVGWTNDPNGLTYLDGEYHLFFQHNPFDTKWGNMTWGHAVSPDLVHWTELGDAIHPDKLGTIFSGSAVVDHNNTSGFQKGDAPPLVAFYTSAGNQAYEKVPFTQSMAYSTDRGRTWTTYAGNPIIGNIDGSNRDPKVFWHEPTARWLMVFFVKRSNFVLFGSDDLKAWEKLGDIEFPGGAECPELFELPVDGNAGNTRWVMWEGGGRHLIGRFDGKAFTAESDVLPSEWGSSCYAGQTWNDAPDGRRIFIGWMRDGKGRDIIYPGMPFNQQMTIPRELTLRTTEDGIRLLSQPAREIEKLRDCGVAMTDTPLTPETELAPKCDGELFDIEIELEPGSAQAIELNVRGEAIRYDATKGTLSCKGKSVEVAAGDGPIALRVLVDRTSIELFASDGRHVMSFCFVPAPDATSVSLTAEGGTARVRSLDIWQLKSIWK